MTQRQQPHDAGTFPQCPDCQREPRHLLDGRRRPIGGHLLACSCGETTKYDSLQQAVAAWCAPREIPAPMRLRIERPAPVRLVAGRGRPQ